MIHRALLVILALAFLSTGYCQEVRTQRSTPCARPPRCGENAGYGSRDATVLSMMGWGLGLGVAIATICALIPNNTASSNVH